MMKELIILAFSLESYFA